MHISFITSEYPNENKPEGGLGNYISKVSQELIYRGHKVSVFILAPKNNRQIDQGVQLHFIKRLKFHWRFHQIKFLHPWLELWQDRSNAFRLRKAVLKQNRLEKFDILQTPNYKAPGLALSHNGLFPLVCRCSSYQPLLRSANNLCRTYADKIADHYEAKQLHEAEASFSPSEFIADVYDRFERIKPLVIRTPIDIDAVEHDNAQFDKHLKRKKYLLYFGAMNGVKGVDILIEALPNVLEPHNDINFVFVGRNDHLPSGRRGLETIRERLKSYFENGRVLYFPSMPKSQLYPIISGSLGVVMPSRVDNYPNACLEALSLGVPVVGTYNSSLDEMIEEGKTGFLAKNGDAASLAQAIEGLLSLTPSQREAMTENIKLEIERISNEDRGSQLISFYEKTIEEFWQAR